MKLVTATLLLVIAWMPQATAALSRAQLDTVSVSPPPSARLDPNLAARDINGRVRNIGHALSGRPAFVNFVDYTCNTLCGTDLQLLSNAIQKSHLDSGQYRILVIGIDPKDAPKDAREMERKEIPTALRKNTVLLLPDAQFIRHATAALGFHYVYDPSLDQFAHPATILVIGADGALRATLSPFDLTTTDLRTVLQARIPAPSLIQQVRLLCYAYDPATGIYTLRITFILKIAAVFMVLAVAASVFAFARMGKRVA